MNKQDIKYTSSGLWYVGRLPTIEDLKDYEIGTLMGWNILRIYRSSWEKVQPNKWCETSPRGVKTFTDANGVMSRLYSAYSKWNGNLEYLLIQID